MAKDGLWARPNKAYALEKHSFLERFGPMAINVTARKPQRHYIDLFAGPGRNVDEETGDEFEGAAVKVVRLVGDGQAARAFTHATLVNLSDDEHVALSTRIQRLGSGCRVARVTPIRGDANIVGPRVLREIAEESPFAYALVFADPANPSQLPWSTVKQIGQCGITSVDLYVLMPLDMGVTRLIPRDLAKIDATWDALTSYFGSEEWWPIVERFGQVSTTRPMMRAGLLELYKNRLSEFWPHVEEQRDIVNRRRSDRHRLYRMLFCTRHPVAGTLADYERDSYAPRGQLGLFGVA